MCANHSTRKKQRCLSVPLIYLIMIFLGIFSGLSEISLLKSFGLFISDLFIKVFKCISLPIIALSIIVTLSGYRSDGMMKVIWRRTMIYTLATTLLAAGVSCILYILIHPSLSVSTTHAATSSIHFSGYFEHIANLIPESFIAPFIEHQVISVLFLGMMIGIAIRFIPDQQARETITQFFRGAHGLMMVITSWIITMIPLGLYGFITASVIQLKDGRAFKGIGEYLLVIVLANLVQGFIMLPIWLKSQGVKPFKAFKAMLPALSLAFFSKSSVGSLPVTMDTIEKNLDVKPEISRFVLPLCTSINMNGCAAFIFATVIYLMQNHGIEVTYSTMALWVVISTIAAIGNAGVPMGCFLLSASLLASMNVPITLMGIILPFYSLIDMLETGLNVWSDACVTKVVDQNVSEEQSQIAPEPIGKPQPLRVVTGMKGL